MSLDDKSEQLCVGLLYHVSILLYYNGCIRHDHICKKFPPNQLSTYELWTTEFYVLHSYAPDK